MPFTSPLLTAVAGLGFDCLCEYTHGIPHPTSSSSNFFRFSNQGAGTWNVISDPKGITLRVVDHVNGDAVALNPSGTLKLTVITHPTYSSSNSSDEAGFTVNQLSDTSTTSSPSGGIGVITHKSFQSSSTQTLEDVTILIDGNQGTRPGLYFGMKRAILTDTFNITGRLLIGINKT
tara:strand:- start:14734 stop:15261 length:528 start_codon:yes stop_codon:yes gene_type:complete